VFIVVSQIFQRTFLKMNRFAFSLYLAFIASILVAGCTAPAHLRDKPHASTLELSSEEKMQQTIGRWRGIHISKATQKWGAPKEVNDDGTGWQTYIWQIPVHGFLPKQASRMLESQNRQGHPIHSPRGMRQVSGTYISTGYTYQLTFYTRPNGIIDKTDIKKDHDPASEFKWK
jgi:hypothetical protein